MSTYERSRKRKSSGGYVEPGHHMDKWQYTNERPYAIEFVMEPWGDITEMPAGATYEVIAEGPNTGQLETRVEHDVVTIFAWPGSSLKVLSNGVDITEK